VKASAFVREMIEREEWVPRTKRCGWDETRQLYFAYLDYKKIPTFGVGHKIERGDDFSEGRTEAEVYDLFARDVARFEDAIAQHVTVPLEQHEYDALICFAYNCGPESLRPGFHEDKRNTAIWYLNLGRKDLVPQYLLAWDKVDGVQDKVLHARRAREGKLFVTPYSAPAEGAEDSWQEEAMRAFSLASDLRALVDDDGRELREYPEIYNS